MMKDEYLFKDLERGAILEENTAKRLSKMAFTTMARLNDFWVLDREKQTVAKDRKMSFDEFMNIQHSTFKEFFPNNQ